MNNMKWTKKGHEFDEIIPKLLEADTTYRLWGAAQLGKDFCEKYANKLRIVQIVDKDSKKWGESICHGITTEEPENLVFDEKSVVVVTCSFYDENRPIIEKLGYIHMKNLFYYEDFY